MLKPNTTHHPAPTLEKLLLLSPGLGALQSGMGWRSLGGSCHTCHRVTPNSLRL